MTFQKIAFIGAGKLAHQLAKSFNLLGFDITAICSRTLRSAQLLAKEITGDTICTTSIKNIPLSQYYIIAVPDKIIPIIVEQLQKYQQGGVIIHTSGTVSIKILSSYKGSYGVLYPLQTFTKGRSISFKEVPCFVEGNTPKSEQIIFNLARSISDNVHYLKSEKRKYLHLAAVFSCNFVNHLYDVASQLLVEENLSSKWIHPLMRETLEKALEMSPRRAQTGPAIRYDSPVIAEHLKLLQDNRMRQQLYDLLTKSIFNNFGYDKL